MDVKKAIQYILFLIIGLVLLYFASKGVDTQQIIDSVKEANWWWIAVSMCLSYLAMILRGWRWNIILEPTGHRSDHWTNIHAVAFGYCMNNLVPRSGELARCVLVNRAEHIPLNILIGNVILERIVDMMILGIVVGLTFLIHADELNALFSMISGEKGQLLGIIAVIGVVGFIVFLFLLKKLRHIKFIDKIAQFIFGIVEGIKSILKLKKKIAFMVLSFGIWACWLLMAQAMMYAIPITSNMHIGDTLFFMVAGSFGMLIPTQGGLGAYHFMSKTGFEVLGYTAAAGLTFAWISWVGKTILELVVGAVGFFIVNRYKIKPQSN